MLESFSNEISSVINKFDEKQNKKLGIESLQRLASKLSLIENKTVEKMMNELKIELLGLKVEEKSSVKLYLKKLNQTKEVVKKELDLHQKGSIIELHTGLGMIFGIAIGTALESFAGLGITLAVGISVGLAVGAGIGSTKEGKLEKEGKIY